MIKILFVCLGNICRSPMAEFVFKNLVNQKKLQEFFFIDSAATSSEEVGNEMHRGTIRKLTEENIPYTRHIARQLLQADYNKYDYIIGMDESNVLNIKGICGEDKEKKIYRLLDFTSNSRDIADPWYTGNLDKTYTDVINGCTGLLDFILNTSKNFSINS